MEIKDNIVRKKIESTIEILQAVLQGKDIEHNSIKYGWSKIYDIVNICPSIIGEYRIANDYRPCTKKEFVNLLLEDVEHMTLISTTTGKLYYINSIKDDIVMLVHNEEISSFNYNELFENYVFYNRSNPIIGVENK